MAMHLGRCGRTVLGAVALVAVTSAVTTQVVSQQQDWAQDPAAAHEKMMEAWMKLAQPGPEHREMAKWAGSWNQKSTHWMYPGAEPEVSSSRATMEPVLGGRFILQRVDGEFNMGGQVMPFEGLGIHGFDNGQKKYVYAWVDNHGTLIMMAEGTADETGKVITYYSELDDPTTGGTMKIKSVSRVVSDDRQVFEMSHQTPDGSWFKNMEMVSTRTRSAQVPD